MKFKILWTWISMSLIVVLTYAQEGDMNCELCSMTIEDPQFMATATNKDGKTYKFDAIECLVNYLKKTDESSLGSLNVANYNDPGTMLNATTAYDLVSKKLPSPMGANLSAYSSKQQAEKMKASYPGEVYDWPQLKEKFKNSRFGATHNHHNHYRPDSHAPIGVMGDHLHAKGGWMLSFRYMNMAMNGNKSGTSSVDNSQIYEDYMVAPQQMNMQMFMLGVMYAPTDKITLMAMQSVVTKDMDLRARMMMNGMVMFRDFSTSTSGLGDLKITGLFAIAAGEHSSFHLNGGFSIPVGSVDERGDTPMMNDVKLPYPMQLGSGTFDLCLGGTYKENYDVWSWGVQSINTIRTGKNSEDYRFGNLYELHLWGAYPVWDFLSISGRLTGSVEGKLSGADTELNPMMVPTADTANFGNEKIRALGGVNISFPASSKLKDLRVGVEAGAPIYENYNGVQMDEDLNLVIGVKYGFM